MGIVHLDFWLKARSCLDGFCHDLILLSHVGLPWDPKTRSVGDRQHRRQGSASNNRRSSIVGLRRGTYQGDLQVGARCSSWWVFLRVSYFCYNTFSMTLNSFIKGLRHHVIEDDTYENYVIPKNTTVIANIWSVFIFLSMFRTKFFSQWL